jgi:dolichyl-phosphate beta-glucosyltransferase
MLLEKVPLLGHVLVVRFALVLIPIFGALLALTVSLVKQMPSGRFRRLAALGLVAVLLPILPVPIPVRGQPNAPAFITEGVWRDWVAPGKSIVAVPVTSEEFPHAMEWQRGAGDFALAGGYFLGPGGEGGRARFGAAPRPTARLMRDVYRTGQVPVVTAKMQQDLRKDAAFWNAGALVLPDRTLRGTELRRLIDQLAGPGWHVSDVTIWPLE